MRWVKIYQLRILILIIWMAKSYSAVAQNIYLDDNHSLIMAFIFEDGINISDDIEVYGLEQSWYLPLGELADAMDVSLNISIVHKNASGFIMDENRTIFLDLEKCILTKNGLNSPFDCSLAVIKNNEIYIESSLFMKIFEVKMTFDFHKSMVVISPSFRFLIQERLDRHRRQPRNLLEYGGAPPLDFYKLSVPEKKFSGPAVDQRLGLSASGEKSEVDSRTEYNIQHDTYLGAEIYGYTTRAFIGGDKSKIFEDSLNVSKKNSENNLLGPLRASEVQLIDYSFPALNALTNGGYVTGGLVSSFPLNSTSNFSTEDFRGPLPAGWEVELYQNDTLIGRFNSIGTTQYEFKNIPLFVGMNRFSLIFYGPQGQKREEVKVVNVDSKSIKSGQTYYLVASGTKRDSEQQMAVAQVATGLGPRASLSANYFSSPPDESQETINYGTIGLSSSFGRLLTGYKYIFDDKDSKGTAQELSVQIPFERFRIGISQTYLDDFKSEVYNKESTASPVVEDTRARINFSFPFLSSLLLSIDGNKSVYDDGRYEIKGVERFALKFWKFHVFHTINYDNTTTPRTTKETSTLYGTEKTETRFSVAYKDKIDLADLSFQYHYTRFNSASVRLAHSWLENKSNYGFGVTKQFDSYSLDSSFLADSNGLWQILLSFSYGAMFLGDSLSKAASKSSYFTSAQPLSSAGVIDGFVFLDYNQNKIFDGNDYPLADIGLNINNQESKQLTDSNGKITVAHLPVYQPIGVSVSYKTLTDPALMTLEKGYNVELRPSAVTKIDIPVGLFSEISGTVSTTRKNEESGVRAISLLLKNSETEQIFKKVRTAKDGYYFIEFVPPGQYTLEIDTESLISKNYNRSSQTYKITVPETGLEDNTFDFTID